MAALVGLLALAAGDTLHVQLARHSRWRWRAAGCCQLMLVGVLLIAEKGCLQTSGGGGGWVGGAQQGAAISDTPFAGSLRAQP